MVDESCKRIYVQKSALKLLHKFDLCIFSYNLYVFAIFHELSYDYFNLCKSSVYVLPNIMMQTLYLPFLSWCHSFREYIQCVKTGEGSLLETLTAITGKSTPISGSREFPPAMKLLWLCYAQAKGMLGGHTWVILTLWGLSLLFKELIWNQAEQDTGTSRISSLTRSSQLMQNRHYPAIFSHFSRALQVLWGVQHPAHWSYRALGPNSSTWWRHTLRNLTPLASLCSHSRRMHLQGACYVGQNSSLLCLLPYSTWRA